MYLISAFVSGRLVSDNVFVAFEIYITLYQEKGGRSCKDLLKLDMCKAYDRIE